MPVLPLLPPPFLATAMAPSIGSKVPAALLLLLLLRVGEVTLRPLGGAVD